MKSREGQGFRREFKFLCHVIDPCALFVLAALFLSSCHRSHFVFSLCFLLRRLPVADVLALFPFPFSVLWLGSSLGASPILVLYWTLCNMSCLCQSPHTTPCGVFFLGRKVQTQCKKMHLLSVSTTRTR